MLWKAEKSLSKFFVLITLLGVKFVLTAETEKKSVKKELKDPLTTAVISNSSREHLLSSMNATTEISETVTVKSFIDSVNNQIVVDEPVPRNRFRDEIELPESYKTGFYLFIGLSLAAILTIVARIYGLRLHRAERRYGVHGDRSTQELTPLPVSIEDDESDNEDHTLFDVNRQIRIL